MKLQHSNSPERIYRQHKHGGISIITQPKCEMVSAGVYFGFRGERKELYFLVKSSKISFKNVRLFASDFSAAIEPQEFCPVPKKIKNY
jgi:hypothetical protein